MPFYQNMPGVQLSTLDGGLRVTSTPQAKPTFVLGTSPQGPSGIGVNVTDPTVAATLFGTDGTLIKAMYEVLLHSDNVVLFRIGTAPGVLTGVGKTATEAGFTLTLGQCSADAGTRYAIWYSNGALYLWLDGNLVLVQDDANDAYLDSGDSLMNGASGDGLFLGVQSGLAFVDGHNYVVGDQVKPSTYTGLNYKCTVAGAAGVAEPVWNNVMGGATVSGTATFVAVQPSLPNLANALTVTAACAVATQGTLVAPTFTPAVDGLGLDLRETYVAQDAALDLLSIQTVPQIYCPNALADAPNVAFYVSTDPTTASNNPATNDALDWLKTTIDQYGNKTYSWASIAHATFLGAADRLAQGYHEVNFAYQLARFAAAQQEVLGGCLAFIGTNGPAFYNGGSSTSMNKFDPASLKKWVGVLPTYDVNGNAITCGKGLLGLPYLVGCTSSKLNPLCVDYASGHRSAGMFENDSNEYDGGQDLDKNGNPIDIGAYVHTVGDMQLISSRYAYQYASNMAGVIAGRAAGLDQKLGLTYKTLNGITQVWWPNFGMMDSLTFAKVNVLRGDETTPTILHDRTGAMATSDWTQLYRMNLKFLVSAIAFSEGKKFIGTNAINGLQLASMKTAMDADGDVLKQRGYITAVQFNPYTTASDARIGSATCDITFQAPDQLCQLKTSIGITR
jgi:hypothetical protein